MGRAALRRSAAARLPSSRVRTTAIDGWAPRALTIRREQKAVGVGEGKQASSLADEPNWLHANADAIGALSVMG